MFISKHQALPPRDEETRRFAYEYYVRALADLDSYSCLVDTLDAYEGVAVDAAYDLRLDYLAVGTWFSRFRGWPGEAEGYAIYLANTDAHAAPIP